MFPPPCWKRIPPISATTRTRPLPYRGRQRFRGWLRATELPVPGSTTRKAIRARIRSNELLAAAAPSRPRPRRALVIGAGPVGTALARALEDGGRYQVVGFLDAERRLPADGRWEVLGGAEIAPDIVREREVEEVFLADEPTWRQRFAEELTTHYPAVSVRVVPTAYEALTRVGKIDSLGDVALLRLNER